MNAIILAAGKGTRLRPLTNDCPKCMIPVCGIPIVEQQIRFLHEVGIYDIILVSGYKANKLHRLKQKYGVNILHNNKYNIYNNIYSLYLAQDFFSNSYILEGDIYMHRNCLQKEIQTSTYFSRVVDDFKDEWQLIPDKDKFLKKIIIGSGKGNIMSGISYWTDSDANLIKKEISQIIKNKDSKDLFWDNAVLNIYTKLNIHIQTVKDIYEIDTVQDLKAIKKNIIFRESQLIP